MAIRRWHDNMDADELALLAPSLEDASKELTKAELTSLAEQLGIEVGSKWTKADIQEAIDKAAAEAAGTPDAPQGTSDGDGTGEPAGDGSTEATGTEPEATP